MIAMQQPVKFGAIAPRQSRGFTDLTIGDFEQLDQVFTIKVLLGFRIWENTSRLFL